MDKINWGIIGCGDVTEVKSGPAFNKVENSSLVAVMRRNEEKVKDYAIRHQVSKWYTNAGKLINDPDINAIYIATPPSSHEQFAIEALQAKKFVYVEKPMAINTQSAKNIFQTVLQTKGKLVVAHYRREQPFFKKIKELVDQKAIGEITLTRLKFFRKNLSLEDIRIPKIAWRVDEAIAGAGLFYDIAPHQLDMMYHLFGDIQNVQGFAVNHNKLYSAVDTICGNILFQNKVLFTGEWCFDIGANEEQDYCEIIGEDGSMHFSFFGSQQLTVIKKGKTKLIDFPALKHVQEPMIEKVVGYFLGKNTNPCSAEEGVKVMEMLDKFTSK